MFTIDISLKGTGMALSVQRKEEEAAETLYSQLLQSLRTGDTPVIELTCEKSPEKKVAILCSEISAIQISSKATTTSAGRAVSFIGQTRESD